MRITRPATFILAFAGLNVLALVVALYSPTSVLPALTLQPIIHTREEDKYEAMKSAPVIVLGQLGNLRVVSYTPKVPKPPGIGGPDTPTIPMYLVQQSAKVIATLRGNERDTVKFYYWIYARGKHGGTRLFNASPGSGHVLFLREEADFLRMVGDYPAYDVEISSQILPIFISEWNANTESESDLFERFITAQLRAVLETISDEQRYWRRSSLTAWMGLTSPFFVASKLDSYCRNFPNRPGQIAACIETGHEFPGRCEAYRLARELGSSESRLPLWFDVCKAGIARQLYELRYHKWFPYDWDWSDTPERRRLAMRLYASAMDGEFRKAACEAAATMPESRDIPECATLPGR